ncbi:hypothetical protein ACJMK2_039662 [Sinanodonta woodiana]|uniref:Uncharacterized protein n=1 Tax=Sinanodonta woodiana TaxID=1069815 RepID=A0ABD3WG38_SINWO
MSNTILYVNESTLAENKKFVNEVDLLTSYNHRPQSGGEAATQSVATVMEYFTRTKLPLSVSVASKLCRKRTCQHLKCKINHRTDDPMSST